MRRSKLLQEGVGVEAARVAASLMLGGTLWRLVIPVVVAAAHDLGDLYKEHLTGELQSALALAASGGDLRAYPACAVLLASQEVDLLLIEVPLGLRARSVAQLVGLFERLRDSFLFHPLSAC